MAVGEVEVVNSGERHVELHRVDSAAEAAGPLAATQIFAYFTYGEGSPGYFPGAPFIGAAALTVCAAVLFTGIALRFDLGHKPSVAVHPKVPEMSPPGQMNIPNPTRQRDENEPAEPPV